ncbi:nucleotide-binding universal stress UspA family protein [Lentzea atacamensis]|uniref:Nucleotide-binding universal stress UspA family protein n=1 Tax=Lentzea atacamensis TaxID=531938 RepID=A0ABX9EJB2_9PSEU|nr:universal stress protein [Lentzea atacamensis]RAS71286.1 nucleotide-binding universal stress UspA family protein [Lentzea atacamensis]
MSGLPVVVGVDGSSSALAAVAWAARACVRHDAPLRLVHAYTLPTRGYPEVISSARELRSAMYDQGRMWLSQAVAVARAEAPDVPVEHDLRMEHPTPVLLAESTRAREVVVGSHGLGGFTGALVGSTAVALSVHGECPVVVVRGQQHDGPVVVGVDLSPGSDPALGFGFEEAAAMGVPLVAALAQVDEPSSSLNARLSGWPQKHPDVAVEELVVGERPIPSLLELGERAGLLVVGSRGRGGFAGMLLGSTSQALIYHAPCPVAVVRPA